MLMCVYVWMDGGWGAERLVQCMSALMYLHVWYHSGGSNVCTRQHIHEHIPTVTNHTGVRACWFQAIGGSDKSTRLQLETESQLQEIRRSAEANRFVSRFVYLSDVRVQIRARFFPACARNFGAYVLACCCMVVAVWLNLDIGCGYIG